MAESVFARTLLAWLMAAGCGGSLVAADTEAGVLPEQPYQVARWTTDHGLPQNRISCLQQTRDGYLWLGTWVGLVRFDGARFTVFGKFNTSELADDTVTALAEDRDGTLWIATRHGLVSHRAHQFHRHTSVVVPPRQRVLRLVARQAGGLWLQLGDFSILYLNGGKLSPVCRFPEVAGNSIRALREAADGSLDIVTGRAWLTWSPATSTLRTNPLPAAADPGWQAALVTGSPGRVWLSSRQGLHRYTLADSPPLAAEPAAPGAVDFLYEDQATNVWVNAQPGRLWRQDRGRWTAVGLADHTAPITTICMGEDAKGNLWLGTDQGLMQLRTRQVRTYTVRDGLAADHVWSVCEGADDTIWVGTQKGLSRLPRGAGTSMTATNYFGPDSTRCVWPARAGGAWVASRESGVYEVTDQLRLVMSTNVLPDYKAGALYEDRAGRLLVGTRKGVVAWQDGQMLAAHTEWAGLAGSDVRCILEDRAGTFWFGTHGQGLTRLRAGKFEVFTQSDGLGNNRVWAIHEDAEGTLWLGTENGLTRYRQGRFHSFGGKEKSLQNPINWILEDDFGSLWLSGLRGIHRVKREQLNAVAEGRQTAAEVATFGTFDGMASNETNGEGQPAGWKARDGRLWFPTTAGVVVIDPRTVPGNEAPLPVVIEQVRVDGEVMFGDGATRPRREPDIRPWELHLAPGRGQLLEVAYTAITTVAPLRTRFRYRLVGRDAGWREETTARLAHYTNLRPGRYRFEVVAANHFGVWSPTPVHFSFSLAPHFYETWPFYGLSVLAAVGLAAAWQSYRLRWQRRLLELEQQRALANERTRIARDLHDDLGTALTGLALELDVIGRAAKESPPVADRLGETAQRTRALAERMREVVWTVNPKCDTLSSLASFIEQQIGQFLRATDMRVRLEFPEDIPAIPLAAEARHQLALSVREALTNVVRHARASEVVVTLAIASGTLLVRVQDNGCGFQPGESAGQGLENLRARLEGIGGRCDCESAPGAGTSITFRLPLQLATTAKGVTA